MSTSVLSRPRVADAAMAERGLKRWQLLAEASSDRELAAFVRDTLVPGSAAHALLEGVFGSSPFLSECLVLEPGVLRLLLSREAAGLLVVRGRWVDVTALLGLGTAIAVMAFLVPPAR